MRFRIQSLLAIAFLIAGTGMSLSAAEGDPLKRAGSLGTKLGPVEPADREEKKLPEGVGVKILEVLPESAAAEAGLKPGDIVVALNAESVKAPAVFAASVSKLREGDKIRVDSTAKGRRSRLTSPSRHARKRPEPILMT